MVEQRAFWMDYQGKQVDLYRTNVLIHLLSEGGKRPPIWQGDLDLSSVGLETLPDLSQIEVTGDFNISNNRCRTFRGCPVKIGQKLIANNTRLGTKIDGNDDPMAFMEGCPQEIGGDLEIVSTYIDYLPKKIEAEMERMAALRAHVKGKVISTRVLFERQEWNQKKMAAVDLHKERLGPEKYEKIKAKLIQENRDIGAFRGTLFTQTPVAYERNIFSSHLREKKVEEVDPVLHKMKIEEIEATNILEAQVTDFFKNPKKSISEHDLKKYQRKMVDLFRLWHKELKGPITDEKRREIDRDMKAMRHMFQKRSRDLSRGQEKSPRLVILGNAHARKKKRREIERSRGFWNNFRTRGLA